LLQVLDDSLHPSHVFGELGVVRFVPLQYLFYRELAYYQHYFSR
jgi:hypothetical protein